MLISSIVGAAAFLALQADPTRAPRDAYTRCLRTFMEKSVKDKTSLSDFEAALPQQCSEQETAFRTAIQSREKNYKTPPSDVEQIVKDELDDARGNIKQIFQMSTTPA
jgi:hypothetical protein